MGRPCLFVLYNCISVWPIALAVYLHKDALITLARRAPAAHCSHSTGTLPVHGSGPRPAGPPPAAVTPAGHEQALNDGPASQSFSVSHSLRYGPARAQKQCGVVAHTRPIMLNCVNKSRVGTGGMDNQVQSQSHAGQKSQKHTARPLTVDVFILSQHFIIRVSLACIVCFVYTYRPDRTC